MMCVQGPVPPGGPPGACLLSPAVGRRGECRAVDTVDTTSWVYTVHCVEDQ